MRPRRLADRVLAHAFGGRLDGELAAGAVPESSVLRAARAQEIVSLPQRLAMAGDWDHLLSVACAKATDQRRIFICADQVAAAAPAIRELMTKLVAPLPVRARGVAMASVLLTDAAGPVYNRDSRLTLPAALAAAISQLDPALPLTDAA